VILDAAMWYTGSHPVYHTVYTALTVSSQPVQHTFYISPTRWIKTHHITASSITPHRLNFKSQDFNHYPFLSYIYITIKF